MSKNLHGRILKGKPKEQGKNWKITSNFKKFRQLATFSNYLGNQHLKYKGINFGVVKRV